MLIVSSRKLADIGCLFPTTCIGKAQQLHNLIALGFLVLEGPRGISILSLVNFQHEMSTQLTQIEPYISRLQRLHLSERTIRLSDHSWSSGQQPLSLVPWLPFKCSWASKDVDEASAVYISPKAKGQSKDEKDQAFICILFFVLHAPGGNRVYVLPISLQYHPFSSTELGWIYDCFVEWCEHNGLACIQRNQRVPVKVNSI